MLFNNHLNNFTKKRNWNTFREKQCHNPKVIKILQEHIYKLRKLYFFNQEIKIGYSCFTKSSAAKLMMLAKSNYMSILKRAFTVSIHQLNTCWGLSKMSIKDFDQQKQYEYHMTFVEFLEYICRVVYITHFSNTI